MELNIGSIVNLEAAKHKLRVEHIGNIFILTNKGGVNYFAHRVSGDMVRVYDSYNKNEEGAA